MKNILDRFSLSGKQALIVCPENPYGAEIAAGLYGAGAKNHLGTMLTNKGSSAIPRI